MRTAPTDGLSRRRARLVVLLGAIGVIGCLGLVVGLRVARLQAGTERRSSWLDRMEGELREQIARGPAASSGSDPGRWLRDDHAVFDRGRASWRVHSFHFDEGEGGDWSGVGDVAILMDDDGHMLYSRSHFCDGTLPWALGSPDRTPPRPADLGAFLALLRGVTWTTDRDAVASAMPR